MPEFLGFVRFGVGDGCPCASPEDLRIVQAFKVHHGWHGFTGQVSDEFLFKCYLTLTPGAGFGGESARSISRLTGLSSGSGLSRDPGYSADGTSHFAAFHGSYTDAAPPYTVHEGTIDLSSEYAFATLKADADDILFSVDGHPAGFADNTFNQVRRKETKTGGAYFGSLLYGSMPTASGSSRTYTEPWRFAGGSPATWWGGGTVDGGVDVQAAITDPEGSRLVSGRYFLLSVYRRMNFYTRERAFIPCAGFYSSQTVVQVDNGFGGWTDISDTGKVYWYHSGAYINVAAPHVPDAQESAGDLGYGASKVVRVLFWIDPTDTPPGGTGYGTSSSAGQDIGC